MTYTKPRFWYHVSRKNLGDKFAFTPQEQIIDIEPVRARICVAPTIPHCLAAVSFASKGLHVYRTYRKMPARYPYEVPDSYITKERWLLKPTCFIRMLYLDFEENKDLRQFESSRGSATPSMLKRQEKDLVQIKKFFFEKEFHLENPHCLFYTKADLNRLKRNEI